MPALVERLLIQANRQQQRIPPIGFGYAVIRKYGEDSGARLSALLTYYGFLSAIPILLIVVWSASQILRDDPSLRDDFIAAVVPDSIADAVTSALASMPTTPLPLIIGILGLVFTGNGIVFTAYEIINQLQGIPHRDRFGFVPRYLRAFATLLALLIGIALLGGIAVGVARLGLGATGAVLGLLGSWVVLSIVLLVTVALLSASAGSWRAAWPGAILGGFVLTLLVTLGSVLLGLLVTRSGSVYGPFAAVVGLFSLLYLVGQGVLFSAETAVVWRKHLWPRSLIPTDPTAADQASLLLRTRVEERSEADRVVAEVESNQDTRSESISQDNVADDGQRHPSTPGTGDAG